MRIGIGAHVGSVGGPATYARELVGACVYDRVRLPVTLLADDRRIEAWCYVAKPDHEQFASGLDHAAVEGDHAVVDGADDAEAGIGRTRVDADHDHAF